MRKQYIITSLTILFALLGSNLNAQSTDSLAPRSAIQINALEFIGRIYSCSYSYRLNKKNHAILGLAYQNMTYDFGTTHAASVILGYRRYFWKGLNADFCLWPAYNKFYEKNERAYYNSLELWSEFRMGYDFTFKIGSLHWYLMAQFILGKGLVFGNKPQSFKDYYKNEEKFFYAPNIAFGIKF